MNNGFWIYADELLTVATEYVFKSSFKAKANALMTANISADTRYRLYINGNFVCDGPSKGTEYNWSYEQPDLTRFLKNGLNEITIRVIYYPAGTSIGLNAFRKGHAAIWFDGTLIEDGIERKIVSDNNFTCERVDSIKYNYPNFGLQPSVSPFEHHLGEYRTTPIKCHNDYPVSLKRYNTYGAEQTYPLSPRTIPLLRPEDPKHFTVVKIGKGFIELDAGRYVTAMLDLKICGEAGKTAVITYGECYYTNEDGSKEQRDNTNGIIMGVTEKILLTGKEQIFAPFSYRAFRYIRISADTDLLKLNNDSTYSEIYYPLNIEAEFTCSNEYYNRMWETSIHTLRCCNHELMVDCPYYEQQQYDMDVELQSLYMSCLSTDTRMIKKAITDMAHSQIPEGMLRANYPSGISQIIADFPLYWIFMLLDYLKRTGDISFVASMNGTMQKILDTYHRRIDKDGLIGRTEYWQFVDWVPGWECGVPLFDSNEPMTVDSLLYAAALKTAAEISNALGNKFFAEEYLSRQKKLITAVNTVCYCKEDGLYRTGTITKNYSQHTSVWAVLSGAVEGEEASRLMRTTMKNELPKCSFSMNYFLWRALEKAGIYNEYAENIFDGWKKMLDLGCTTWCENPESPRSECHGWSATPIYELSTMILGIQPTEYGMKKITVKPFINIGGMTFARGKIPTEYGTVSVNWEKKNDTLHFEVQLPKDGGIELTVILPNHEPIKTSAEEYKVNIHL